MEEKLIGGAHKAMTRERERVTGRMGNPKGKA
jgi:hypothetical protein